MPGSGEPLTIATGPVGFFTAAGAKPPKRTEATVAKQRITQLERQLRRPTRSTPETR